MKFFDLYFKFESVEENRWMVSIADPTIIKQPRETEVDFLLPFSPNQLQHWRERVKDNIGDGGYNLQVYRVGEPPDVTYLLEQDIVSYRGSSRSQAEGPFDLTKVLGKDLFSALFQASTSQAYGIYRRSRDRALRLGRGLRLWLSLSKDDTLDQVPFEFLFDPWDGNGGYLARRTDVSISIVRAVPVQRESKGTPQGLLRLWYISASPDLLSPITDFDIISEVCWETGLRVLPHPILKASTNKLIGHLNHLGSDARYSPNIIHVSAHGDSNQIFMEQRNGQIHTILVPDLASQLACVKELHLVVFSVCDTDNPIDCAVDLCRQGIAVVTMQFPITQKAVKRFQREFYTNYFRDHDLDCAVAKGRSQIALNIPNTMEWGTPVTVVPEFPCPSLLKRFWRWFTSATLHSFVLVPRWMIAILVVLILLLAAVMVYEFKQPPLLPPAIHHVIIYTREASFRAPDDGKLFTVPIRGQGATVPIEVLVTHDSQSLDFSSTLIGEGKIEKTGANEYQAQFEYTPPLASTTATLEFCINQREQEAMRSCMMVVLDIILVH